MSDFNNQFSASTNGASETSVASSFCQPNAEYLANAERCARGKTARPTSPSVVKLEDVFSVIIVSFNTRELTLQCLKSLQQHAPVAQVIVVDNASSDGSASAIREAYPEVQLLELSQNIGFGRANTLGLKHACTKPSSC